MREIYSNTKNKLNKKFPKTYSLLDKRKKFIKYFISGGTAAFVHLSLLFIFTDFLGLWYILSTSLGFLFAFLVSFYLQKFWTFRDKNREKEKKQMVVYFLVGVSNMFINAGGMYVLVDFFGIWFMLAQVIMNLSIAVSSFVIYNFIIFRNGGEENSGTKKNILISTGVYPPEIGGPATYANNLSKELEKRGYKIKIITYGNDRDLYKKISENIEVYFVNSNQNIFFRYIKFFQVANKILKWADFSYVLDLVSVGFPTVLASKFNKKKIFFRTGGDFLWEKSFQSGKTETTLRGYYKNKKDLLEKLLMRFSSWILNNIDLIIFSTELQKNIYHKFYRVSEDRSIIIKNAYPKSFNFTNQNNKNYIVFAGRLIKLKNIKRLLEAFSEARDKNLKLFIYGDGPEKENIILDVNNKNLESRVAVEDKIPQKELARIIDNALFVVLPSLTEISPNLALECISGGKPIVLTVENGLDEEIMNGVITINPESTEDIAEKINYLLNKENLTNYTNDIRDKKLPDWSWEQVAEAHDKVFQKFL